MLGCEFVAGHLSRASLEFLEVLCLAAQHPLSLLEPLGVSFETLEALLELPGVLLRPSWSLLGRSWQPLGASLGALRGVLGPLGRLLGRLGKHPTRHPPDMPKKVHFKTLICRVSLAKGSVLGAQNRPKSDPKRLKI